MGSGRGWAKGCVVGWVGGWRVVGWLIGWVGGWEGGWRPCPLLAAHAGMVGLPRSPSASRSCTCSVKGVLKTRAWPKRSCRPAVARNTPPNATAAGAQSTVGGVANARAHAQEHAHAHAHTKAPLPTVLAEHACRVVSLQCDVQRLVHGVAQVELLAFAVCCARGRRELMCTRPARRCRATDDSACVRPIKDSAPREPCPCCAEEQEGQHRRSRAPDRVDIDARAWAYVVLR